MAHEAPSDFTFYDSMKYISTGRESKVYVLATWLIGSRETNSNQVAFGHEQEEGAGRSKLEPPISLTHYSQQLPPNEYKFLYTCSL